MIGLTNDSKRATRTPVTTTANSDFEVMVMIGTTLAPNGNGEATVKSDRNQRRNATSSVSMTTRSTKSRRFIAPSAAIVRRSIGCGVPADRHHRAWKRAMMLAATPSRDIDVTLRG